MNSRASSAVAGILAFCLMPAALVFAQDDSLPRPNQVLELRSRYQYLHDTEETMSHERESAPAPPTRTVVGKTIVHVGMSNDDLSVTPVPGRAPVSGPPSYEHPLRQRVIIYREEEAPNPDADYVPAPQPPPHRLNPGGMRYRGVSVGMGDDLAVSPLPPRNEETSTPPPDDVAVGRISDNSGRVSPEMGDDLAVTPLPDGR